MKVCELLFGVTHIPALTWVAVNRVNWLRAKARADRWKEELLIVRHEMSWTINAFVHQTQLWTDLKDHSAEDGARAYAAKQEALWNGMCQTARQAFDTARGVVFSDFVA
jgi:hypothetical protein